MKDLASQIVEHFEDLISKMKTKVEKELVDSAIQMVRNIDSDSVAIGSGILINIVDYPIGDILELHKIIKQAKDRHNWQRWNEIDPLVVADLRKSEKIAAEVSKRRRINIQVQIDKALVTFYSKLRQRLASKLEIENIVDGFIEAWKLYDNWISSEERKKIVAQSQNWPKV